MLPSALLLFSAIGVQGQMGNVPSQEFLGWRGWSYLAGGTPAPASLYRVGFPPDQVPASTAETVTWRTKVFILRSTERVGRDSDGLLRTNRETIEDPQVATLKSSLTRVAQQIALGSQGQVSLKVDYEEEPENLRGTLDHDGFGADALRTYVENRLNGGGYEAEDKVFRGPYPSVFVVIPGAVTPTHAKFEVFGSPVTVLPLETLDGGNQAPDLDTALLDAWREQAQRRARARGYGALSASEGEAVKWADLADLAELSGKAQVQRAAATKLNVGEAFFKMPRYPETWITPFAAGDTATDTEKGTVARISLKGRTRGNGVCLPARSDGMPIVKLSEHPTVQLNLKTTSLDPISLRLEGKDGKRLWISFGRDIQLPKEPNWPIRTAVVKNDGTWQHVAVNVAEVAKAAGVDEVMAMAVEFSPRSRQFARVQLESADLLLDDIQFGNEAESGLISDVPEEIARAKVAATATSSSPDLIAMLGDASPLVRLNAADAFTRIKDPSAESALATATFNLDQVAAERAVDALSALGTATARDVLRRTMKNSLGDFTRARAARRLGETKDPKLGGDISILLASRNWLTRLAAVEALSDLPGREAAILRLAFLKQDSSEIKLAVIRGIDPADEVVVRQLLWPMVNEPLDAIRAACALKVAQSPLPDMQKEAFAAIKDDSRTVRRLVLEGLVTKPNEAYRAAFQVGVTDATPSVRAAAVRGFATLKDGATVEEVAPALEDPSELVALALTDLAKARKVTLPESAIKALKSSPFPTVRTAAEGLTP